jgi:hypothetical protein
MANNKNKPVAPVAAEKQTDTVEAVLAETVTAEDGTVIEAGTEVLVDAKELVTEEAAPAEATTPAEVVKEAAPVAVPAGPVVSHNPTFIQWPTDPWGMTAELKDTIVRLASRIQGAEDKKRLADAALAVGIAHLEAKFLIDAKVREDAIAAVVAENEAKQAIEETIAAQGELF